MSDLDIFCVTDKKLPYLEDFCFKLAGVGNEKFSNKYILSDKSENIFYKEKYYSELTFHYWYWKNQLNLNERNKWIGFCQKRRFWIKKKSKGQSIDDKNFKDHFITSPDEEWKNYDSIICEPISVNKVKYMKLLKRGFRSIINDPGIIFNQNKKTILLHFNMHHGHGNLEKAISVMDEKYRNDFLSYVKKSTSFNPNVMFISKSQIINNWFSDLFDWLFKCEKIFGFHQLQGYDTERLYAYLAERFLPFWFKRNTKCLEWPWIFFEHYEK